MNDKLETSQKLEASRAFNNVDKPLAYFFAKNVSYYRNEIFYFFLQEDKFGLFIVLPIHKESLRTMMQKTLVNIDAKMSVLNMLKPIVCEAFKFHGDIKDIFDLF